MDVEIKQPGGLFRCETRRRKRIDKNKNKYNIYQSVIIFPTRLLNVSVGVSESLCQEVKAKENNNNNTTISFSRAISSRQVYHFPERVRLLVTLVKEFLVVCLCFYAG